MPWMWIVAGPNGAGKSTFTNELFGMPPFSSGDIVKLNADEVTVSLRVLDPSALQDILNLQAARIVDRRVRECIHTGTNFLVETVLSSDKYQDDLELAKAGGFDIGLIYMSLHPPELSPLRVQERVAKGGHAVDRDKALDRYWKSHAQLCWFATRVDLLYLYDNSMDDGRPVRVAEKLGTDPLRHLKPGLNFAVDEALRTAFPAI